MNTQCYIYVLLMALYRNGEWVSSNPKTERRNYNESESSDNSSTLPLPGGEGFNSSVCERAPAVSRCRGNLERWHYDNATGQCVLFYWGGCGDDRNVFLNCTLCMNYCDRNGDTNATYLNELCEEIERKADEDYWAQAYPSNYVAKESNRSGSSRYEEDE